MELALPGSQMSWKRSWLPMPTSIPIHASNCVSSGWMSWFKNVGKLPREWFEWFRRAILLELLSKLPWDMRWPYFHRMRRLCWLQRSQVPHKLEISKSNWRFFYFTILGTEFVVSDNTSLKMPWRCYGTLAMIAMGVTLTPVRSSGDTWSIEKRTSTKDDGWREKIHRFGCEKIGWNAQPGRIRPPWY